MLFGDMAQLFHVQHIPTKTTCQKIVFGIVVEKATIEEGGLDERRF
jgi:hypothetical protein